MARLFPEPNEFIEVEKYVIKDTSTTYDRYWNKDTDKWVGLLEATHFTKEETDEFLQLPQNGKVMKFWDLILTKTKPTYKIISST